LFLIYINNINGIDSKELIQYADDTTINVVSNSTENLEIQAFEKVNLCTQFFEELNLKVNYSKSNFIYFQLGRSNNSNSPVVMINNHALEKVNSAKFLGIYIDSDLSWDSHIDHISKKISSGTFLLRYLAQHCKPHILRMAYFGLIQPYINYGIILWGSCPEYKLLRIFILQKKAIRIISKLGFRESCREIFKILEILTLPSVYIYETIMFCLKKINLVANSDVHDYDTRNSNQYRLQYCRLEIFQKMPSQAGIKLFNKLPEHLKIIQHLNTFKTSLKNFFIQHAFYSVGEFMDHTHSTALL